MFWVSSELLNSIQIGIRTTTINAHCLPLHAGYIVHYSYVISFLAAPKLHKLHAKIYTTVCFGYDNLIDDVDN